MTTSPVVLRPRKPLRLRRDLAPRPVAVDRDRRARRTIMIIWALLLLNTLTFFKGLSAIPIPSVVGKAVTQGSLPVAFLLALALNRRRLIRPNVYLCLASLLILGALITTLQPQHLGTVYRTVRLAGFITTLWLLTPWWGRRDYLLVRCHLMALTIALSTVVLGLFVAPGYALSDGRLTGAIWPIPPPQVAHYAAVITGLVVVLWLSGQLRGRVTLCVVLGNIALLILTHTRTALVGLLAGILVAGLSLIVATARARRLFAIAGAVATVAITTLSSVLTTWLARGQGTDQLSDLTGRTQVWTQLLDFPRNKFQEIFGFGLSNASFNGLSIDSNWLASYQEQGLFGVTVCALMLVFVLVTAYFRPRGVHRALALFLVTYCLVASFTEVGFTDASPYLLELTIAASLVVPSMAGRRSVVEG
jgi:hypothetical protein